MIADMEQTLQSPELVRVFAANVKARRKEIGLTQAELAEKAGASQPYIAQMEGGTRCPGVEFLAPLAEALQTTPDALLTPNIFSAVPS